MVSEIGKAGTIKAITGRAASVDQSNKPADARTEDANPTAGGGDNVTLTGLATRLQVLIKSIEHLPEVDRQRVADFQQALAHGDYDPPANEIAARIEAFERQLATPERNP